MGCITGLLVEIACKSYELRFDAIMHLFWVNMKYMTTVTIGANVRSNGRVSLWDSVV